MISFDEATKLVADAASPVGIEPVVLAEAAGRTLAAPVAAMVDAPPADSSAMDGYAVRGEDLPGRLRVIGEAFAGRGFDGEVESGACVRIFTGAPVPRGADRVVIQELVERDGHEAQIPDPPGQVRHIRARGSDFAAGDLLLDRGRTLDPRAMVAAAGADVASLDVFVRPRVLVLGTGDELAPPGEARLRPGSIPESVTFGIAALVEVHGGLCLGTRRLADDLPAMERAAGAALDEADLVVVTGGASVGEKDFAKTMFEPHGLDLLFSKVAIKPGKPVWLGRARDRLVIGLPGNPTSALVTARLLLAPLIAGMAGRRASLAWRLILLSGPLPACGDRETFHRARLVEGRAEPIVNRDSSAQRALALSDLLLRRRAGAPAAEAGEEVEALDF